MIDNYEMFVILAFYGTVKIFIKLEKRSNRFKELSYFWYYLEIFTVSVFSSFFSKFCEWKTGYVGLGFKETPVILENSWKDAGHPVWLISHPNDPVIIISFKYHVTCIMHVQFEQVPTWAYFAQFWIINYY